MEAALNIARIQFAFTIGFHYIFVQLTLGLALIILIYKTLAVRRGDPAHAEAARFWAKIFGINFGLGVVTGIPMEFQFGTNWSEFSRITGGVIGQTLAMEGCSRSSWNRRSSGCSSSARGACRRGSTG